MRWVRTNRQWSAWLALAAMTLQLALSFGHFHLERLCSAIAGGGVQAPPSQQNPAQHPANEADDYCAICANIHLARRFFAGCAALLVAFVSRTIEHFGHFAFVFISPQRGVSIARSSSLMVVADLTSPRVRWR
jgi:hypothetical protein